MSERPYLWIQPDADTPNKWNVCMNPDNPVIIKGPVYKKNAEETVAYLLERHAAEEARK